MDKHGKVEDHKHKHTHPAQPTEESVPWVTSPMKTWDEKSRSFSPRHEASTIELFFDLFFVANLATFTQYHAPYNTYITNRNTFWSYVAFFVTIWMSWFHVVCFDARFAADSVWERACKVVHFCTFAGFALVGYKFNLFSNTTPRWIYRVLCWILFTSRFWLAIQYLVTAMFCSSRNNRHLRLTLPLSLNTFIFFLAAAVYAGLFAGFSDTKQDLTGVIIGMYSVIFLELVGTLGISCFWRKLSFRATHIGERLGLLCLIIIGEGVIGTTKTITRTMGKNGVYVEGVGIIFCIILILVFIWILYFDNLPKYRFSAVKQQFWMALHLPLHLAILGVVEGSQHLALARYIYTSSVKLADYMYYGCVVNHLNGQKLAENLTHAIEYFKINESAQGNQSLPLVFSEIYNLGNQSGICSPANTRDFGNGERGIPPIFTEFYNRAVGAMFQAFDIDIPAEGNVYGLRIANRSWGIVYRYYWSAIVLLLICLTLSALLADRKLDFIRYRLVAFVCRGLMVSISITVLVVGLTHPDFANDYFFSPWILPTVTLQLWIASLGDRGSKWLRGRRERKEMEHMAIGPGDVGEEGTGYLRPGHGDGSG